MRCFYSFSEVLEGNLNACKRVIKFLRRLKEAHLRFLDLKNPENIEKAGTRVNNCKFAKDSSIRATLFQGKVQ